MSYASVPDPTIQVQVQYFIIMQLVLASSSSYRKNLLQRLGLPFVSASPEIDESIIPNETVQTLTARLARAKALKLAPDFPAALVIGSDQACLCDKRILGKPGSHTKAIEQLQFCSGKSAHFHTALALLNTKTGECLLSHDIYTVHFRELTLDEIEYYLQQERPFDCAGSFKAEGLGIALFSGMQGQDFHSLIGLPLISLCHLLRQSGLNPLLPPASISA